jgi:hypothetical protein
MFVLADTVESLLPLAAAGREHDLLVPGQVDRLLLGCTGAEVETVVGPHRHQRRDVRPSVTANRRDPEQLGGLEHAEHIRPWSGR